MDVYDELGVKKVINGLATVTMLGGSLMPPEVVSAMAEAARYFVEIDELQEKAGRKIAELTHNEAAYVSCGAAAGLVLSTAACIAGMDEEKRARLPFTEGMRNEILIHRRGRVGYDFAIRQAGGKLIEVGDDAGATAAQLEGAINERTAGIFVFYKNLLMDGQVPLEEQIAIAKRHHVPLVIDAAAHLPPVENLRRFTQMGADLVLFSGGKGLCGPQSSGLILGRRDLIQACAFHAPPRPFIGRPMKAGKEEIAGLLAAVRWYTGLDHRARMDAYEEQVAWMIAALNVDIRLCAVRSFPNEAGQPLPRVELTLNEGALGMTRDELLARLYAGNPAVALAAAGTKGVFINPQTLQPGEERIVVERIQAVFREED